MKTVARYKRYLLFSLVSSVISSLAVLLCIFELKGQADAILKILTAAIFWLGLIFEQLFIWLANALRRSLQKQADAYTITGLPGICSFLKTELGFFTDTALVISLIVDHRRIQVMALFRRCIQRNPDKDHQQSNQHKRHKPWQQAQNDFLHRLYSPLNTSGKQSHDTTR